MAIPVPKNLGKVARYGFSAIRFASWITFPTLGTLAKNQIDKSEKVELGGRLWQAVEGVVRRYAPQGGGRAVDDERQLVVSGDMDGVNIRA